MERTPEGGSTASAAGLLQRSLRGPEVFARWSWGGGLRPRSDHACCFRCAAPLVVPLQSTPLGVLRQLFPDMTRKDLITQLDACGGDPEVAAHLLLSQAGTATRSGAAAAPRSWGQVPSKAAPPVGGLAHTLAAAAAGGDGGSGSRGGGGGGGAVSGSETGVAPPPAPAASAPLGAAPSESWSTSAVADRSASGAWPGGPPSDGAAVLEVEVDFLVGMLGEGVTREAARAALRLTGGDVEAAADALLDEEEAEEVADDDSDDEAPGRLEAAALERAVAGAGPSPGGAAAADAGGAGLHSGSAAFPDVLGMHRAQRLAEQGALRASGTVNRFALTVTPGMSDADLLAAAVASGVLSPADAALLSSAAAPEAATGAGSVGSAASSASCGSAAELHARLAAAVARDLVDSAWEAAAGDEARARALLREWAPADMATAELLEREAIGGPADAGGAWGRRVPSHRSKGSASTASSAASGGGSGARGARRARQARAQAKRAALEESDAMVAAALAAGMARGGGTGPRRSMASNVSAAQLEAEAAAARAPTLGSHVIGERVGVSGSTHQRDVLAADVAVEEGLEAAGGAGGGVLGAALAAGAAADPAGADAADAEEGWQTSRRRRLAPGGVLGGGRGGGALGVPGALAAGATGRGTLTAEEARAHAQFGTAQQQVVVLRRVRKALLREATRSHTKGDGASAAIQADRAARIRQQIRSAQRAAADATIRARNASAWAQAGGGARAEASVDEELANAVRRGEDVREATRRTGASRLVFVGSRAVVPQGGVVDLHGQLSHEAVRLLADVIVPAARADGVTRFEVITGRGAHSKGGRARMRGAVERWLKAAPGLSYSAPSAGSFAVRLR